MEFKYVTDMSIISKHANFQVDIVNTSGFMKPQRFPWNFNVN